MRIHTAGVQFMRDNPERFIESNTENSWLRYLNNMCIQGTWADALIIQAVADALKVAIQIVESNQGFAPLTTVYPVQERYFAYNYYYRSYLMNATMYQPLPYEQMPPFQCAMN